MLKFKKINFEDKNLLQRYYNSCPYESCEYSAGIKLFWNRFYPYEYAISKNGSLIVKYEESGNTVFDMPVYKADASTGKELEIIISEDLDEIDEYCIENEIVPVFSDVPEDMLVILIKRYNFTKIENFREAEDYIYRFEDLRDFKGRHYSGQRNHINKFKSANNDFVYRELKPNEDLSEFWNAYYGSESDLSTSYIQEKTVAMDMAKHACEFKSFASGVIEVKGKVAAFCIGEILGNRVIVHIEKALTEYEGIYPLIVSEFLKHLPQGIEFVNREDDSSDRGLRISKLQYKPCKLLSKYVVLVQSELLYVDKIPEIKTQRLVLNEIRKEDAAIYRNLCLDDERNIYWGYDYKDDLEERYSNVCSEDIPSVLPEDYFYEIAHNDFEQRICLNLAIRLDKTMIGEIVLYEADYKGGIEIGCRLLKDYEGHGFGREAMNAAANWAIYTAGFRKIKAKCFRENLPSFKMLSSFMRKTAEDEQFIYFEKSC